MTYSTPRTGCGEPQYDLRRYRYHTGATLRPLAPDEPCPVLFRDIGPEAMAWFLAGKLTRLAGPMSPITYLRTSDYQEPYTDHGRIGRLVFLNPQELTPWHSGVETIYVAHASRMTSPQTVAFVPPDVPLSEATRLLADVRRVEELQDVFDRRVYHEAIADTLARLNRLNADHQQTEVYAEPLRRQLQSPNPQTRETALNQMHNLGISESDLCTAWHHLPDARRAELCELFPSLQCGNPKRIRDD